MWKNFKKLVNQMDVWGWGMMKIYAFTVGIVVGAFFPDFIKKYIWIFVIIILISFIWFLNILIFKKRSN